MTKPKEFLTAALPILIPLPLMWRCDGPRDARCNPEQANGTNTLTTSCASEYAGRKRDDDNSIPYKQTEPPVLLPSVFTSVVHHSSAPVAHFLGAIDKGPREISELVHDDNVEGRILVGGLAHHPVERRVPADDATTTGWVSSILLLTRVNADGDSTRDRRW